MYFDEVTNDQYIWLCGGIVTDRHLLSYCLEQRGNGVHTNSSEGRSKVSQDRLRKDRRKGIIDHNDRI